MMGEKFDLRIIAVLAVALFLRAYNLSSVPAWDWDEGANVNYASNLIEGRMQFFAYHYNLVPHPPLFFIVVGLAFKILGASIYSIRLVSLGLSLCGVILVYMIVRRILKPEYALLGALLAAIYPELIFWGRIGFANNLLGVLVMASMYFLLRFLQGRRPFDLVCCGVLTGLCPLVEYTGFVFLIPLCAVLYWHARDRIPLTLALSCAPAAAFLAFMLLFGGAGFTRDLLSYSSIYPLALPALLALPWVFARYSERIRSVVRGSYFGVGKRTPAELFMFLGVSVFSLVPLNWDLFYTGGLPSAVFLMSIIGVLFIEEEALRSVFLTYSTSYAIFLAALNRWDHMGIPLHYVLAPCAVFFLAYVIDYIRTKGRLAPIVILIPLSLIMWSDLGGFALKGVCEMPAGAANGINDYINARTGGGDLVLTYTYLAPGLRARTTVLENFLPYNGYKFAYMARNYSPGEFYYNLSPANIGYAVVPSGLASSFEDEGYIKLASEFRAWKAVYETQALETRTPGLGLDVLKTLGAKTDCETDYVVLENPERAKRGDL